MKTKSLFFFSFTLLFLFTLKAQVGVGNTNPQASLDISASSTTTPANNDGILIPRMSAFPSAPGTARDGMLIFYTGTGASGKGFYYWNNGVGWTPINAADDDWITVGADIERQSGDVYIGNASNTNNDLYISDRLIDWDNPIFFIDPASSSSVNEINFSNGSRIDPSIHFGIDTNSGFYRSSTDQISMSLNNTERYRFNTNGQLEINPTSTGYIFPAARGTNTQVLTTNATGLVSWQTPTTGDINQVIAGNGLTGGAASGNATINAVGTNGITTNPNDFRLGGALIQATTISNGTNALNINLNNTGDFNIQDNGINKLTVLDNGDTVLGGDLYWRDINTGGTVLGRFIDDGDDGRLQLYENGGVSIDLDANGATVFNQQGFDRDFRIESDASVGMFSLDAALNRVSIGAINNEGTFNVTGNSYFSDDIHLRDGSVNGGDLLVRIFDSSDDGVIDVYENNVINHRIHGNGTTIFNNQAIDIDFRIASDTNSSMFMVDAGDDVVRIANGSGGLAQQGTTRTVTSTSGTQTFSVDYIANFQRTSGSTIGLGTAEFVTDGGNQVLMFDSNIIPFNDNDDGLGFSGYRWTALWATDGTINTSDLTLKKDIKPLDYGLDQLMDIETITYKWKDGRTDDIKIGFSAQNLQQVIPEVVRDYDLVKPDEKGSKAVKVPSSVLGVYYSDIIPVTVKAIQELNVKIESLETENKILKQQLSKLQQLEARLLALENNTKTSHVTDATED